MRLKSLIITLMLLCFVGAASVSNAQDIFDVAKIEKQILEEIKSKVNEESPCTLNPYPTTQTPEDGYWTGTKSDAVMKESDAKFVLSFDAGERCKESLVRVSKLFGSTQEDFEDDLIQYIANNPIDNVTNLQSYAQTAITNVLLSPLNQPINPTGVYDWWKNEFRSGSRYDHLTTSKNISTKKDCGRASSNGTYEHSLCGQWGAYRVLVNRADINGAGRCRANTNSKEKTSFCWTFFVMPTIPPGIFDLSSGVQPVFLCENGDVARLNFLNDGSADGVCLTKGVQFNPNNAICKDDFTFEVAATGDPSGDVYVGAYFKETTCGGRIYGKQKFFKVIPFHLQQVPNVLGDLKVGCDKVCDLEVLINSNTLEPGVSRNVAWYTTQFDFSKEPFAIAKVLDTCLYENEAFFTTFIDTVRNQDGELCQRESQLRSSFDIVVLSNLFGELYNSLDTINDYKAILDNREFPSVKCEENEQFNIELEDLNARQVDSILEENSQYRLAKEMGYKFEFRSVGLDWYRLDNGVEVSINDDPNIYKIVGSKKLVCAENTGIEVGDYTTKKKYKGVVSAEIVVYLENKRIGDTSCVINSIYYKTTKLREPNSDICSSEIETLNKEIQESSLGNVLEGKNCHSYEIAKISCPGENQPFIGLSEIQLIDSITNQSPTGIITNFKYDWSEEAGLEYPEQSRTKVIYNEIPVDIYDYQVYELNYSAITVINLFESLIKLKHCAVVYRCPDCVEDDNSPVGVAGSVLDEL